MNLQHSKRLDPSRANACDDTPVSHRPPANNVLRIILADDHPVVLLGAEMALGDSFSIVAQAQDADELIHHLQCTPCDLLISDYSMPYGHFPDGLALMGYLRRHFSHLPLIVMTMLRNPSLLQALLTRIELLANGETVTLKHTPMAEPMTSQHFELDGLKPVPGMQVNFSVITDYGGFTTPMTLPVGLDS